VKRGATKAVKAEGAVEGGDRRVLPRFLRKPVRMLGRIEWHMPRHAGLKGLAALFLVTGIGGTVMGDHIAELAGELTAQSGLAVREVRITGQSETSELDVLQSLDLPPSASLVTLNVGAARERVQALPWVKSATLRKLYPDALEVTIGERTAFALWRDGDDVSIVDRDGGVITGYVAGRYATLPLVVGKNANKRAAELVDLIGKFPTLQPRVRAAVLVADRRWNLVLESGVEIMLPEEGAKAALDKLAILDKDKAILSRDITRVDLRLSDRVVVALTEEAMQRRKSMLEQRLKNARKGGAA
jgi:cell division protein FtsQ